MAVLFNNLAFTVVTWEAEAADSNICVTDIIPISFLRFVFSILRFLCTQNNHEKTTKRIFLPTSELTILCMICRSVGGVRSS